MNTKTHVSAYFLHDLVLVDQGEVQFVRLLTYEVLHRSYNIQLVSIDAAYMGLLFPIKGGVLLATIKTVWSGLPGMVLKWCRELKSEDEEESLLQCLAYTKDVELGVMVSKDCFAPLRPMTYGEAQRFISQLGY